MACFDTCFAVIVFAKCFKYFSLAVKRILLKESLIKIFSTIVFSIQRKLVLYICYITFDTHYNCNYLSPN